MPIEVGIWRIDDDTVERVPTSSLQHESRLEDVLERDLSILGLDSLLVVARQVVTSYASRVDLLALDVEGTLYVIELKRDRTPREVVAQALDYGYWARRLDDEAIADLHRRHSGGEELAVAFERLFGEPLPATLNESHQLIIVASALDPATERIVSYAADFDIPLNVVFFQYFRDRGSEYLARSWLIDPAEAEQRSRSRRRPARSQEAWNGQDFYFSAGEGERRTWEDMVRFGFISAGGGRWYSNTLRQLEPGHRVFACIPKVGYVGVGVVEETVAPVGDVRVDVDGHHVPLLEAGLTAPAMNDAKDDPERREYVVRVRWLRARTREQAFWKPGMYANQNSVTRLRQRFTLEQLVEAFELDDGGSPRNEENGPEAASRPSND